MRVAAGIVLFAVLAGCAAPVESPISAIRVRVHSGPTCPVVSDPPDPECDDRPVEGAQIVVRDGAGAEVARMTSGADGTAAIDLAPGRYVLVPQPVEGLLGTGPSVTVTVVSGVDAELVTIDYDTGIR